MTAELSLEGVTMTYGALTAVDDVSLDVERGEICALVGPNGSGKTSLLNTISGLSTVARGRILLRGIDVTTAPPHQLARMGLARTFQLVRLLPGVTVEENVIAGCYASEPASGAPIWRRGVLARGRATTEVRRRVAEALDRLGLADLRSELANELPFGLQRRVEVARAIVAAPSLLLFDEPAAGLSEGDLEDLSEIVQEQAGRGCAVILVDHHLSFVLALCPRAHVLNFGRTIFDGRSAAAVKDPQVREAYVGA